MTFAEFVNQYTSLAINGIPNEDYYFLKSNSDYSSLFRWPALPGVRFQNMRFRQGKLQSHKSTPYASGDDFQHAFIFEWANIRDMFSDFTSECNFDIDVMSVL